MKVKFSQFISGQLKSPAKRICLLLLEFDSFSSPEPKARR